jgi:hypothetical protein
METAEFHKALAEKLTNFRKKYPEASKDLIFDVGELVRDAAIYERRRITGFPIEPPGRLELSGQSAAALVETAEGKRKRAYSEASPDNFYYDPDQNDYLKEEVPFLLSTIEVLATMLRGVINLQTPGGTLITRSGGIGGAERESAFGPPKPFSVSGFSNWFPSLSKAYAAAIARENESLPLFIYPTEEPK